MKVYIPATVAMLQQLVTEGSLWPVNGTAFAVTPTLREAYAEGDDDELAEVALREAALASLRLLAADTSGPAPGGPHPKGGGDREGPPPAPARGVGRRGRRHQLPSRSRRRRRQAGRSG